MAVNSAGSAANVQQALVALRQTVQAEQVAAVAVSEAATQAAQTAQKTTAADDVSESSAAADGRGRVLDVKA